MASETAPIPGRGIQRMTSVSGLTELSGAGEKIRLAPARSLPPRAYSSKASRSRRARRRASAESAGGVGDGPGIRYQAEEPGMSFGFGAPTSHTLREPPGSQRTRSSVYSLRSRSRLGSSGIALADA